jgi:Uma2 family endonuclease
MAIMHVPAPESPDWSEVPPEPRVIKDLLDLRNRVDTGRRRAEIIEGRLIVSPMPVFWHELACVWLDDQFRDTSREKGWFIDRAGEIQLPPTSDLIEPDVMILRDADEVPTLESTRPLDYVLLVAEVVSRSSIREDREVKPRACALAGIPFYVLVDRFTSPMTVSVFGVPGPNGYATVATVQAGEKLHVPDPFDVTLDTATLPAAR